MGKIKAKSIEIGKNIKKIFILSNMLLMDEMIKDNKKEYTI